MLIVFLNLNKFNIPLHMMISHTILAGIQRQQTTPSALGPSATGILASFRGPVASKTWGMPACHD